MRATFLLLIVLLAGCATESDLTLSPPPGVDLSGHWRLNVADSDDPLRLAQAMASGSAASQDQGPGGTQRGGRSGGSRSRNPGAPLTMAQPVSISAAVMADLLHWPSTEVEIHQDGGVVTFNSDGDSRVYQPVKGANNAAGHGGKKGHRSDAPPRCGWSGTSLIVHIEPEDDQPGFDAQYRVSEDGVRLLQLITLQGGRLTGFTMSRVWDRE
jgi:hypothetical protein